MTCSVGGDSELDSQDQEGGTVGHAHLPVLSRDWESQGQRHSRGSEPGIGEHWQKERVQGKGPALPSVLSSDPRPAEQRVLPFLRSLAVCLCFRVGGDGTKSS